MLWPDLAHLLQVEIGWRKETAELIARCRTIYYEQTGRSTIGWDQGNLRAIFGKLRVEYHVAVSQSFLRFSFVTETTVILCNPFDGTYSILQHLKLCRVCVSQSASHPPKIVAFAMCIVGVQ